MKKISFSFTKSKAGSPKSKIAIKKDIQFIDSIESNSIKVKGEIASVDEAELVIPIKNRKLIEKEELNVNSSKDAAVLSEIPVQTSDSKETLETLAVKEILEDSQQVKENPSSSVKVLPSAAEGKVAAANESTLTDYENVPVADFGLAMLRGMGWKPDEGIGKIGKIIEPKAPVLRPKGIGLGSEISKVSTISADVSEELILKKGAFVQILGGSKKNMYGEVQSFDEDVGRVFIKTALGGSNVSVNESMLRVVSSSEYKKSSRVLNQSKYDEYKEKEETPDRSRRDAFESKRQKRDENKDANARHRSWGDP